MTVAGEPHRISACDRHPSADSVTGFCPNCLRDRLSYLDSPSDLRRSKSQSSAKDSALSDLRRSSCDVRPRTSLSLLFRSDDDDGDPPILIESDKLGLKELDNKTLVENENEVEEEIDAKPMKEHIEIELEHSSKRHSSSLLLGAASVFTQKLSKWRLKQQNRKKSKNSIPIGPSNADRNDLFKPPDSLITTRRSCDIEPRLSIDENPNPNPNRYSFDEPRASWDGYMIARTIPRLAPMLSVIENQMIVEDETNSISESSSSARRNSFDCSSSGKSSGKNRMHVEIDDLKLAATKVVDTCVDTGHLEIDICNDRSKSSVSGPKNSGSIKWKVLKMLGFKGKSNGTREIGDVERDCSGKEIGVTKEVSSEKVLGRKSYSYNRSPNVSDIRGHATPFDRTRSVRYSPSPNSFENGLLRFHLTPPLTRKKKPERRNSVLNSQSNARGVSRLS